MRDEMSICPHCSFRMVLKPHPDSGLWFWFCSDCEFVRPATWQEIELCRPTFIRQKTASTTKSS
jgi:ssDNA-binding Zn-finger/Zn-ribbon topoisomerase 1